MIRPFCLPVFDQNGIRRYRMGVATRMALLFAVLSSSWVTFKHFEPRVFPVVRDFTIMQVVETKTELLIFGTLDKVRQCTFVEVVAYSGPKLVRVVFQTRNSYPPTTRMTRIQDFGPWTLYPKTPSIEIYATHQCATGEVITQLFSGVLVP